MSSGSQTMIDNGETENDDESGNAEKQVETNLDLLLWSTPPGTRTPDPLIKSPRVGHDGGVD